jgi:hypothetical protein
MLVIENPLPTTNDDWSVAQWLIVFAQSLVYVVAMACVVLSVVGLFVPDSIIPEPGVVAVVVPGTYLVGEGDARMVFLVQTVLFAFHWSVARAVRTNRLGFVTIATVLTLTTFAGQCSLELNAGILGERFPWVREFMMGIISVPVAIPFSFALILWNVGLLVDDGNATSRRRIVDKRSLADWLERHRWFVVSRVTGYTLVAACVVVGLTRFVDLPFVPTVWDRITPVFLLFGTAVYGFVSTEYVRGIVTLAAGAWLTGLAAFQYDSVVPGVALPVAVLLTISAAATAHAGRQFRE